MVIKGRPPGDYEGPKSVDKRTYIKILFRASKTRPGWWFLYDIESKEEPVPIGWYSQEDLNKMCFFLEGAFQAEDKMEKDINIIDLRAGTKYDPLFNSNPQGFNNKDGRPNVHSGPPLPDR